ncbi:methylaspartate mutase [Streptomyces sp. JUS-F4]|uniref:methylaspartate mutase n=1 Tax=Streptomyces sp. JUS-F4 TaxID=2951988 RepID=UPI0026669272|nr:methylaspartate mutase [Streptomyces sp. JUS-F4]WKN18658.1 methylaspartate mutase [Streptomyces sp. JUS-F4]
MTGGWPLPSDPPPADRPPDFGSFVRERHRAAGPVVQPRMGFSDPGTMRAGLLATKAAAAAAAGTITIDSYTRVGDLRAVAEALTAGVGLNGYPIAHHGAATTRDVLAGVQSESFAVQVRHGSAAPFDIVTSLLAAGLNATEGGPVSYCLPYGRTPLAESVGNWEASCRLLAHSGETGVRPHLETFGGCMLGQLCPPSLLVAISVLEALFFRQHGLHSISVSYAQQPSPEQNREAIAALRRLCGHFLPDAEWHVVLYTYMGVYPTTVNGAYRLLGEAAVLAASTGTERLIVKTVSESSRIPTIEENVAALEYAAAVTGQWATDEPKDTRAPESGDSQIYLEALRLIEAVRELDDDLGKALTRAFRFGYLDVPYCLHPDNRGRCRSYLDDTGRIRWADLGSLPLGGIVESSDARQVGSAEFLDALSYVRRKYDRDAIAGMTGSAGNPTSTYRPAMPPFDSRGLAGQPIGS